MKASQARYVADLYEDPLHISDVLFHISLSAELGFTNTCLRYTKPKVRMIKLLKKELEDQGYEVWDYRQGKKLAGLDIEWCRA